MEINGAVMSKDDFEILRDALQKIDCKLDGVAEDVAVLKDHVKTQNGRLDKVEDKTDFNSNKIYGAGAIIGFVLITKQVGLW